MCLTQCLPISSFFYNRPTIIAEGKPEFSLQSHPLSALQSFEEFSFQCEKIKFKFGEVEITLLTKHCVKFLYISPHFTLIETLLGRHPDEETKI